VGVLGQLQPHELAAHCPAPGSAGRADERTGLDGTPGAAVPFVHLGDGTAEAGAGERFNFNVCRAGRAKASGDEVGRALFLHRAGAPLPDFRAEHPPVGLQLAGCGRRNRLRLRYNIIAHEHRVVGEIFRKSRA
jgi:hypothetical protein